MVQDVLGWAGSSAASSSEGDRAGDRVGSFSVRRDLEGGWSGSSIGIQE